MHVGWNRDGGSGQGLQWKGHLGACIGDGLTLVAVPEVTKESPA